MRWSFARAARFKAKLALTGELHEKAFALVIRVTWTVCR